MKTWIYNLPKTVLLFALVTFCISTYAQPINYLVLSKAGKKKTYTFVEGAEITYKLKKDIGYMTDRIITVTDSAIVFATYTVPYTDIDKIFIDKKTKIISNNTILLYGVNIVVGGAILNLAYLVNTGTGLYNLGGQMLYALAPIPVFLGANWVYGRLVKTEYTIGEGYYRLRPVILRKE